MEEPKVKGRRVPNIPPGGKALERLHQFEIQRGIAPTELESPSPAQPPAPCAESPPPPESSSHKPGARRSGARNRRRRK